MDPMGLPKIKTVVVLAAAVGFVALGVYFVYIYGLLPYENGIQKPAPQPQTSESRVLEFNTTKGKLLPLLKPDTEFIATPPAYVRPEAETKVPTPASYEYGKAKIVYLPLPNIFEGRVDSAENIQDYRLNKKAIVEILTRSGINPCDLEIYWARPPVVDKSEFTPEDMRTDSCQLSEESGD